MKALEEAGKIFGGYQVDSDQDPSAAADDGPVTVTRDGGGVEDYEAILGDIQFEQMFQEVETRAPMLFGLLTGLMAPKVVRKDRAPRDPTKCRIWRIRALVISCCFWFRGYWVVIRVSRFSMDGSA